MNTFNSLVAILGVYGVRTSALKVENDYWHAASKLFPGTTDRFEGATLDDLQKQLKDIPKNERRRLGCANLRNLRGDWVSTAAIHQAKLRVAA